MKRIITLVIVTSGLFLTTIESAQAAHGNWRHPVGNRLQRKLGIGWSDGYHAYGSPTSWRPAKCEEGELTWWGPTMISE